MLRAAPENSGGPVTGSALFIVFSASHFFFFLFSEPERAVI
jgi:hypothetical protein